MNIRLEL